MNDYDTNETGDIYCADMRENYCRNNTVTRIGQDCSKKLYSGPMNYFNGSEYVPINTTVVSSSYLDWNLAIFYWDAPDRIEDIDEPFYYQLG